MCSMELSKQAAMVNDIHQRLVELTGSRLKLKANMGRSKIIEREGTLLQAHPSLFIVEIDEKRGRTSRQSYQYVDVLTGTVELSDPSTGEPLFPAFDSL
ncbi:MAG: Veg family protein [Coriobacteriales bacterium]|nr:Veg family protein [Coriobacteriales bacterium]